jgi:hypothetical protein
MSHALRVAVAATSLFTCPACVTTGSLSRNLAETIATESAPTPVGTSTGTGSGTPTPIAARAGAPPAPSATGATPGSASGPASADGTTALLAWERDRPGANGTRITQGLTFEPADSRLRLVLTLMNPAALLAGGAAEPALGSEGAQLESTALWASAPNTDWGEESEPAPQLAALGSPPVPGSDAPVRLPAAHPAPEPSTLALTALGLVAVGWQYRRRTVGVMHRSG